MLSRFQRSVIIGTLLRDGAMRCKREALLEVNHSVRQREYVDWKYETLRDLVRTPRRMRTGNGGRVAYRFTTLSLPQLTEFHKIFYRDGKKVVPDLELDEVSLAVWFMDDGSRSRRAAYFNTQQFTIDDQLRLIQALEKRWGIQATLNRDKTYHRIRIAVASISDLEAAIGPHILPSFEYKLPEWARRQSRIRPSPILND